MSDTVIVGLITAVAMLVATSATNLLRKADRNTTAANALRDDLIAQNADLAAENRELRQELKETRRELDEARRRGREKR